MSHKATNYVTELYLCPNGERLTRSEKLLIFVLADRHNKDRGTAHPSIGRLADEALMSIRQVQRCLRRLVEKGVLKVELGGGSHRNTNLYSFPGIEGTGDILAPVESWGRVTSRVPTGDISGGDGCHSDVTQTGKEQEENRKNETGPPLTLSASGPQTLFDPAKEYAIKSWSGLFGHPPEWDAEDFIQLDRLLSQQRELRLLEFEARWDLYLCDDECVDGHPPMDHSLRVFCARWGRYSDWRHYLDFDIPFPLMLPLWTEHLVVTEPR